ncbi:MAG: type II toxin-antitoxin system RelE/ParE family toxin [Candidatus Omnitrophica bacterium]|nr:type II toxin-antitoxin system RelE/ParE family toxin [Candidatus Omnitrophota bacterium]
MKYLKNKSFQRDLRNGGLEDKETIMLDDVFNGRADSIGFKMYKVRLAREGQGKSGGFRSLFFWKKDESIVFCFLFAKNEQADLSPDEYRALRILSKEYDSLTENEIEKRIENKNLMEIKYAKETK